jgi:hypothetical protein
MELLMICVLSATLSLHSSLPVLGWLWDILRGEGSHDGC